MSLSPSQPVEDPTKEDIQKEEVKQLKSPSPPRSKLEAFLRKELEFLGAAQTMIGLICFFFGVIHKFILNFLKHKKDLFSTFHMGYPIWGGLLFTISGFLLIASERKGTKCLVQSSLVMAILSSVVAGIGIWIIWSDLKQISSIFYQCQNQQTGDFCFAVTFLTETAVMVLFLTVLELGIGILLSVNEIIGKIVETWIAKHRKTHHEAFYEELPIYYPITENVELLRQGSVSIGPKDTSESRESLHSRIYQSPEELQKT
ncbi:high affinity immunoglobulin epsilon receptor subunit beta-like [Trichosurus vulpecula]|uniref:high affinity immunoglobulin epsilon receptor subunit beta-like n=1 Tax=Trichosurus vulpecula TaxID=9337 RepID=UPI00186B25BA|nr:high affinity immunoglobulin epsilon receptor subunit beta-like [Trichosurus vulpecula]